MDSHLSLAAFSLTRQLLSTNEGEREGVYCDLNLNK